MSRFNITNTSLSGVKIVQRLCMTDARGFFSRMFCAEELSAIGWKKPIAQINHSYTLKKGTVRGMHYQRPPHAEMKLVYCIRGELFDIAVDIRKNSPTFLQWTGVHLTAANRMALLIPEGFAHGFQALTDDVELLYCNSSAYAPSAEGGINPCDVRLALDWPMPITELSERDAQHPPIAEFFQGLCL